MTLTVTQKNVKSHNSAIKMYWQESFYSVITVKALQKRRVQSWISVDEFQYTVQPLITVTSVQRPPPDLRSVKKAPAEFNVKLS